MSAAVTLRQDHCLASDCIGLNVPDYQHLIVSFVKRAAPMCSTFDYADLLLEIMIYAGTFLE